MNSEAVTKEATFPELFTMYANTGEFQSTLSKEIASALEDYYCCTKDTRRLFNKIITAIVRKASHIPDEIEKHILELLENIFSRYAPIDSAAKLDSFQADIIKFVVNIFPFKKDQPAKNPFTKVTPYDYLDHIVDSVSEGMHESHYYYRYNVEHSPAELLYRELIRLVVSNSKVEIDSIIESIIDLKDPDFCMKAVIDTAGRIGCLYNNIDFLIRNRNNISLEQALHHAVVSKSDKVFYYLLGSIGNDIEELASIKVILAVAVALDRVEYVKHMYYVFGGQKLSGRLYYSIAKSKEMKEFLRQY